MLVLDSSLVDADVFEESGLLGLAEPFGFHRRVGQDEECSYPNQSRGHANEDEHGLPRLETPVRDVLEREGYKTPKDLPKPETGIPDGESGGLLGLGVVLAADQHQTGGDGGLEHANEDAGGEEGVVVCCSGGCGAADSPETDVDTEPFSGGDFLEDVSCNVCVRNLFAGFEERDSPVGTSAMR